MAVKNQEILSAMLDNQASELEIRRFVRDSESNPELLRAWETWNLGQAALHDERVQKSYSTQHLSSNFASRVFESIAAEATPAAPARTWRSIAQPIAKLSIAASIALAFYLGMQVSLTMEQPESSGSVPIASGQDQRGSGEIEVVGASSQPLQLAASSATTIDPEARQRLENYINSVAIEPDEPVQLQQLQDSPLYRLVNEIIDVDAK